MIALLFLVLSLLLGGSALRKSTLKFHYFEFVSASFVIGTLTSVWLAFLVSLFFGIPLGLPVTIGGMAVITLFLSLGEKQTISFPHFSKKEMVTYILFTLLWTALLLPLFTSHMLERKSDGLYSGGGAWGDLALHSTFVNKFAGETKLDLTSPIYASEKTTYPLLIDFYASILLRYGFSLQASLVATGFLFTFAFLQLAYFFVIRVTKSHGAAVLFTILFFFNGGVGVWYAIKDFLASKLSLLTFLFTMQVEYAHLAVFGLHWSNIIADYVLPQRSFLAGLPTFVLILFVLRSLWLAREDHPDQRLLLTFLIGVLPLFHTHTFLVGIGLLGFFVLMDFLVFLRKVTAWIIPLVLLVILVAPQLWWQFGHTFGNGFTRIQFGWMKGNENVFLFWLKNMGLEALFFVFGGLYFLLFEKKQRFIKILFIPLAILFLLTNIIVFQPHDYDNMKLMIYSHFAIMLIATILLSQLWKKRILGKLLVAVLFVGLTITGALSVFRESYTSWRIADNNDIAIATQIKEKTSPYAIFLTADSHNHPVTMLAGRSIVMGYRGWLWTHGIDYSQTEMDVTSMFAGSSLTPALLKRYHVSYVYIGDAEITNFNANEEYFKSHYSVMYYNESGTVYDVTSHTPTFADK